MYAVYIYIYIYFGMNQQMTRQHMHNQELVLENETRKIPGDFEIQTDHLISARRLDLVIVNKK